MYKGILRFLSTEYGYPYVVEPLPVKAFSATLNKKDQAVLSWQAVTDSLEPTADAKRFIVYKRIGNGDFDNGTVIKKNTYTTTIPTDKVVSFKVTALNDGGESLPSSSMASTASVHPMTLRAATTTSPDSSLRTTTVCLTGSSSPTSDR